MSACPQCGTVAKPTDKFCNTCGTPLTPAPLYGAPPAPQQAPPAQAGYAQPPQPQGGGASRCQMGHEIAPGASYCAQGHPIALDAMTFAADPYGQAPQPGYAQPPQPPQQAYGAPPGGFGGYAPPQPPQAPPQPQFGYQPSPSPIGGPSGFGTDPSGPPQGFGAPPQVPGFSPQPAFGAPQAGSGAPQGGFGPPQQPGFGPPQQGFGAPPQPPAYAPPPQPPQQPVFNAPAAPPLTAAPPPPAAPAASNPYASADPNNKTLRGFLVAYQTNASGDFWPLTGGRLVVGRAGAGDGIDIPLADPTISSRHAAFVVDGSAGTIALEDTGSTNGTFVNDEHVGFNGRRDLKDGDRLRFGGFTTIVKIVGRV